MRARLQLHHDTVRAYVGLLEEIFIVQRLQAWRPGLGAREVARPKVYLTDTGLLSCLLGADERRLADDPQVTGRVLENFVAVEILKHMDWAEQRTRLYHYQREREDVDLVIERANGDIAAIEVKASARVTTADTRWIRKLRDGRTAGFKAGVVFYTGAQTVPLGDRLWAVPVSGLWAC